jgi:predicted transcriptional regulator
MATAEVLSDDSRLILNFIRDYPGVTRMQIAENVRVDRFDIAMAMKQLLKHNAIIRVESGKELHYNIRYYPALRNSSIDAHLGSKD